MKNCRRTVSGWQLYTRVRGEFVSHHVKGDTPPSAIDVRDWKHQQHAAIKFDMHAAGENAATTFAEDVATYLPLVRSMPSYRDRQDDLDRWIAVFGRQRARAAITPPMIRQQLETWRAEGYAPSTVNHRRTALMHLWTVLDGKSAPNPARDVPRYREALATPRALSSAAVTALLAAMPESQTKARLLVMAWTGWPQAQIARLEPGDIAWKKAVFIRGRQKGKGVAGVWLPLLPQAWTALRLFKRLGCWGTFSTSSMRASFRLAATKVARNRTLPKAVRQEVADITPYQLRHSFGTLIAGITQDDRAVKTLMIHSDIRQTHRYTNATVDARTAAAISLATFATKRVSRRGRASESGHQKRRNA